MLKKLPAPVLDVAHQKKLEERDALQGFLQFVMLKHLSLNQARFMGGTALVLGYNNPRFSEDVDLTGVKDPLKLKPGLWRAVIELQQWLGIKVKLIDPKPGKATFKIQCHYDRATTISLHVDSQPYPAITQHPVIVVYSTLPPLVCPSVTVPEIMADKLVAVAFRNYLSGRDLFDLWFHWLKDGIKQEMTVDIKKLLITKCQQRNISHAEWLGRLQARMSLKKQQTRLMQEWQRYLPQNFQSKTIQEALWQSFLGLTQIFYK